MTGMHTVKPLMAGTVEVAPVAMTAAENSSVLPFTSTELRPVKVALPCTYDKPLL